MKSIFVKGLGVLLLIFAMVIFASCNIYLGGESVSTDNSDEGSVNDSMMLINESKFHESSSKYNAVSSYAIEDGNYYYFYYLGAIDAVPLGLESASGVYFNGVPNTLKFSLTTVEGEEQQKIIENSVESRFAFISTDYHNKTLSAGMAKIFRAGIEAGVVNADINGVSTTSSQSYVESISKQNTFEQSISYNMTEKNEVGYYFYTPMASVKVYAVVVYNPNTESIEYVTTYNQYGSALPGIYYSPLSFIELSDFDIEFDESKISEFSTPDQILSGEYTVELNPNGGDIGVNTIDVKLGKPYGDLPVPEKQGYRFVGWYADGGMLNKDSIVVSDSPLEAKWSLLTSYCFNIDQTITVSSIYKLNPFFLLTPNQDGETGKSGLGLTDIFDISELKAENYMMRVTVVCDGKIPSTAFFGLDFDFDIYSNGSKIIHFSESISSKKRGKNVEIKLVSNRIPMDLIAGNISFNVSTENVLELELKNIEIYVDFVK